MKVFHYHPQTGVFLGEGVADESPLEPGSWLIPAHATTVTPLPAEDGEQLVWQQGEWLIQPIPQPAPPQELTPLPEPTERGPSYITFWDALLASTVYASIRTQSMTSLPMNTLATEFIALIGDAKAGRPNQSAIQASMTAVFASGSFSEDDAEEFTAALAAGRLDEIYSLTA